MSCIFVRSIGKRTLGSCTLPDRNRFSGPGGWGAKFRDIAHASVETTKILVDAQPLPNVPNALVLSVGRGSYYVRDIIEKYLQALMAAGPATYVVFVDANTGQFVGSASGRQVLAALSDPAVADRFMHDLQEGGERPFAGMGFLVTQSLSPEDSNVAALEKLVETNADALVIVSDDGRRPIAVVDRNRLVAKLMLKLAG